MAEVNSLHLDEITNWIDGTFGDQMPVSGKSQQEALVSALGDDGDRKSVV